MKDCRYNRDISNRNISLIWTFLLIYSALNIAADKSSACYNFLPDVDNLYFSGELSTGLYSCRDICGSFNNVGIEYNQSVKLDSLCFCQKSNLIASGIANVPSRNLLCQCGSKACKSFITDDVTFPYIITSAFVSNKPTQIIVVGLAEYQYVVFDFGDGNTYTTNETMVEHTYISPGHLILKVWIKRNDSCIIMHRVISIESTDFLITLEGPHIVEKREDMKNISLAISGGSNMKLKITQKLMVPCNKPCISKVEYVLSDGSVLTYGHYVKKEDMAQFNPSKKSLIVPPVIFKEYGSLTSLNFFAYNSGILTLYIIRPECKCCSSCNSVSLMKNYSEPSKIRWNNEANFLINHIVMIHVNETGLQSHSIKTRNIEINQGDMVAFPVQLSNANSVKLASGKGIALVTSLPGPLKPGTVVSSFSEQDTYIPHFQALVSKVYTYNLDQIRFKRGNVTIMVEQVDPDARMSDKFLTTFNIAIKKSVIFIADARGNGSRDNDSGVVINVTNYITSNEDINVTNCIMSNKDYFLVVQIMNGTEVTLDVNFGSTQENLPNSETRIKSASVGSYIFPYLYPKCGKYFISIEAKNNMTTVRKKLKVDVLCQITGLHITTSPSMNNQQLVRVSNLEQLQIHIASDSSFVSFNISWGDGVTDSVSHSDNNSTEEFAFTLIHKYLIRQMYVLSITAWNGICHQTFKMNVKVQSCSEPPMFLFDYGTKNKPIKYRIGEEIVLYAEYSYQTQQCRNLIAEKFRWGVCKFKNSSIEKPEMSIVGSRSKCTIAKKKLDSGKYTVILPVEYTGKVFEYEAHIHVIESPLIAQISNGALQVIPQLKKPKLGRPAVPYIFEMDGKGSHDPDVPNDRTGIFYNWFCRINFSKKSQSTFCNVSLLSHDSSWFPLSNQTSACVIEEPGSSIKLNSSCLLLNTSYVFMLNISKQRKSGVHSAVAKQNVEVTEGSSPMVRYVCVTNCLSKINPEEKLVYRYECDSCFGRRLKAKWIVVDRRSQRLISINASDLPNLLISKGELLEGRSYDISVTLSFVGSPSTSKFQFSFSTANKPYGGSCGVTPTEGVSTSTKFSIFCNGWKSGNEENLHNNYEFGYSLGGETDDHTLLYPSGISASNQMNVMLPTGLEKENFWIYLKIRIANQYGLFAEWTKSRVKVISPSLSPGENGTSRLHGLFEDLLNSMPPDLNDDQAVTSYVTACGLIINNLEPNVVPTLEPTPQPGLFGNLDLSKAQRERELADKEKERKLKMEFKEKMTTLLANVDVTNIQQFKAVSDALTTMTYDNDEVSDKSQELTVDIVFKMKDNLKKIARSGIVGANYLQDTANSYGNLISNLFSVEGSRTVVYGPHNESYKQVRTQTSEEAANKAMKLIDSVDSYLDVLGVTKVNGESASRLATPYFAVSVQKNKLSAMANLSTSEEIGDDSEDEPSLGFVLPDMTEQLEHFGTEVDFSIQSTTYKNNVFSWGNASNNIKSEVPSLAIKTGGNTVTVSNTANPIVVNIKNKPEEFTTRNVSLFMPGDLMFNKSILPSTDCSMLINFDFVNDPYNMTQFIVYIQYGEVATSNNYDVKLNMSNKYGMIMTVSDAVPSMLLNHSETNQTTSYNRSHADSNRKRVVYVRKINNRTIILWNFSIFYWANEGKSLHFTFIYYGPMPERIVIPNFYNFDGIEYRGAFNYSVRTICAKCTYWSEKIKDWSSDGCALNLDKTTLHTTSCNCNHLTSFGGFFVAPNELKSVSLTSLKQGYVLLVTVVVILLVYIICFVFARRADKNDMNKTGMCPLIGNNPQHKYMYQITVDTGSQRSAGTTSNVYFNASGENCESGFRHLTDPERVPFQRNNSDVFVMTTASTLGDISYIRIWHDNSGGSWYLRSVKIIDLQTDEEFVFQACRWLAVDRYDGMIDCIVPVTASDEMNQFDYLFVKRSSQGLSDNHIWFSIYARPTRSSFTRCQRLTVAFSLLYCSMLASCMFYNAIPPGSPKEENRIGNFSFKWEQVYVALISALIIGPINVLLGALFRAIGPVAERTHHEKQSGSRTKTFHLPFWCLYLTWFLCAMIILLCCVLVIWYGMMFGNKKSLEWLSSITVFLLLDIIVIQPVIVFLMALLVALLIKKIDEGMKSEGERDVKLLSQNESWLKKFQGTENIFSRMDVPDPPDVSKLSSMRAIRLKEKKMSRIIREIMFYVLYLMLVIAIGFNFRDQNAYNQTKDIKELLRLSLREGNSFEEFEIFENIKSYQNIWDWVDRLLLTQMYPSNWYDLSEKYKNDPINDFPGKIFLNDLNAKIVNGVRLRQMRVKHHSCDIEPSMRSLITIDCADLYTQGNKETRNFYFNWSNPIDKLVTPTNPLNKPWRYLDSSELDTYSIAAKLHSYSGGGYVVEVFPKFNNRAFLDLLKESQWIDRHTRALIVEFATYNAQSNFFDMVIIVFEFPPGGGTVHYHSVETFRLEMYTKETKFFVILSYVLYLIFMIIFCIRESKILYQSGLNYFNGFWNLVEFAIVALSFLAITLFFYLGHLRTALFARMPHKKPNVFINFQEASIWYDYMIHSIALICFFVIIKLIKMLRFNQRVSLLSATLNSAWHPLAMFAMMFLVIIGSVVFSTTIIFGHALYGYRNWFATLSSIFSLLLGKFSYEQFDSTNHNLGPIFFFAFNIMVNWIVMNMFITILNDVFAEVQADLLGKPNEYEILDYMIATLKSWMGYADTTLETIDDQLPVGSKYTLNSSQNSKISADEMSLNMFQHWEHGKIFADFKTSVDVVDPEYIQETIDNFVKCINVIYFHQPTFSGGSSNHNTDESIC